VKHVIYEPISKEKSSRILSEDFLSRIHILKPNILQLKDLAERINPSFQEVDVSSKS